MPESEVHLTITHKGVCDAAQWTMDSEMARRSGLLLVGHQERANRQRESHAREVREGSETVRALNGADYHPVMWTELIQFIPLERPESPADLLDL